jgi:hypothetical protein
VATQKKRVQVPPAVRDAVLVASNHTCCICQTPERPVQIHHIDDDPSNYAVSNLAVLCLLCHNKTQVHGGFGRTYTPGEVTTYRDVWLRIVHERRSGQPSTPAAAPVSRAERLRSLYEDLLQGVCSVRDYTELLEDKRFGNTPLAVRQQQFAPNVLVANKMVERALPKLRVEPGSRDVCDAYEGFRRAYARVMSNLSDELQGNTFAMYWKMMARTEMNRSIDEMREAIHAHIQALDRGA